MRFVKGKVSIITSVYNGANYIEKLLNSVLNQDYIDIEHIIIDDGSKDNLKAIIDTYKDKYKQRGYELVYVYQDNQGLARGTDKGLSMVKGEFLTWINCDDWFEDSFCSSLVSVLNSKANIDVVFPNGYIHRNNERTSFLFKNQKHLKEYEKNKTCLYRVFFNEKMIYGLYLVRSSSFLSLVPSFSISNALIVQDNAFFIYFFCFLKCKSYNKPLFNLLYRNDSLLSLIDEEKVALILESSFDCLDLINRSYPTFRARYKQYLFYNNLSVLTKNNIKRGKIKLNEDIHMFNILLSHLSIKRKTKFMLKYLINKCKKS